MNESFYNSFNARHLNPQEVAKTFIYSQSFERLIQDNHSVLLGARGCGKTTLMKMLTLPALHSWDSPKASSIRSDISFYGIYISTDIYWDVKNKYYGFELEQFQSLFRKISNFSVTTNVFSSLCDAFINLIIFELKDDDQEKETELCQSLIKAWKLPATIPKLKFVKEALNERIDEVNQIIQDVLFNSNNQDARLNSSFLNLDFESSLENLIPKFERIYNIEDRKKWALCFDELEFAPEWLQQKLFKSLRSRKHYILYKLSASPILPSHLEKSLMGEYSATSGNDLDMIKMWRSSDNEDFSRMLIESLINSECTAEEYFGTNEIYNKKTDSYTIGSDFYKEVLELIQKDYSFKNFLVKKGVDIQTPIPQSTRDKDTLFRKMKPTVYYRNAYIESNTEGMTKPAFRSRKKITELFSGIEVFSKICEGNPRWLIGIISTIRLKAKQKKVSKVDQYNGLHSAALRFKNVIANIPVGSVDFTIVQLIERIGEYFKESVLGNEYKLDPKGTFTIDEEENKIPEPILDLIEKGVSQGAFILVDTDESTFDFEVKGKRFRLSYLFSILFYLPMRKYPEAKLSDCLKGFQGGSNSQTFLFD